MLAPLSSLVSLVLSRASNFDPFRFLSPRMENFSPFTHFSLFNVSHSPDECKKT